MLRVGLWCAAFAVLDCTGSASPTDASDATADASIDAPSATCSMWASVRAGHTAVLGYLQPCDAAAVGACDTRGTQQAICESSPLTPGNQDAFCSYPCQQDSDCTEGTTTGVCAGRLCHAACDPTQSQPCAAGFTCVSADASSPVCVPVSC